MLIQIYVAMSPLGHNGHKGAYRQTGKRVEYTTWDGGDLCIQHGLSR